MSKRSFFGLDPDQLDQLLSLGTEAQGSVPDRQEEAQAQESGEDAADATSRENRIQDAGAMENRTTASRAGPEQPGDQIGRYKLLRVLGEGGMGIVYLAQQQEPMKRQVALKIIKPGMDSTQVIRRFEAERQALALLDHPNVAQVYDASTTEAGRPYFAMEYVKGVPITEHCDRQKLTIEERLKLFVQVCEAIQHAHQKGIIHRDVKPSNIQVCIQGEQAIPKVIDFGVAKALNQPLIERTLVTEQGQLVGTPEYISPEQAEMTNQDIDTRSDIYSLGVLLYELLTGTLPFESATLRRGSLEQMRQIIREAEPKTPSARVSSLDAETSTKLAKCCQSDAATLRRNLRGDLDWITLKAMEKDRMRRYQTAHALAEDIERHLNNEPVLAGRPGTLYRFQKLVRRNQGVFAAAAVVAAVLVLGALVSTWQAVRATRAERIQIRLRERAVAGEQLARTHLYAADMVLAQQALDQGNLGRVNELLDKYRPTNFGLATPDAQPFSDLRGWEWRYLWSRSRSDERCTLGSHDRAVDFAVFSDDGNLLATSSQDRSVKIWDVAARREVAAINFASEPSDLCFVPKSQTVAVAVGKEVCFLDGPTGRKVEGFSREASVWSVAYSRDGSRLAIYEGTTLRILDTLTRHEMWRTMVLAGWRVTFSPDGTLLAAATNERTVLLLDAATGRQLVSLPGFSRAALGSLVFSPDGALLACAANGGGNPNLRVWEVATRQERPPVAYPGFWVGGVAFSPDGKTLAISGAAHVIVLWDRATWQVAGRLQGHWNEVWPLAFSPDGKYLASGGKDKTVRIWDAVAKAHETTELSLPTGIDAFNFSTDGSKLCVLTTNNAFAVWDTSTLRLLARGSLPDTNVIHNPAGGYTKALAVSSDGRRLYTLTSTGQVRVWDTQTREFLAVLETKVLNCWVLALSPDEEMLGVGTRDGVIKLWDLETKTPLTNLSSAPNSPYCLAFSADNQFMAIGCRDGVVEAWQIPGPRKLWSHPYHTMSIRALAISPDQRFLAAASNDPLATLWDLQTGTLIRAFRGALNAYNSVAISRDSKRVFASGLPATLDVWDTGSLQSVGTFQAHRESMRGGGLAILSESDTVVSVGSDGVRLLRAPSWAEIEAAEKSSQSGQSP
jgi:WD40 repeat protein/serine/threonine protein kinase